MAGRVLINGTDIRDLGAYVLEGSYASMLAYPSVRNVVANDWHEEDGVEVDLEGAALASRTFGIRFGVSGYSRWDDFIAFLKAQGFEHRITVEPLGIQMDVRFVGVDGFQSTREGDLAVFTARYADDSLAGFKGAVRGSMDSTLGGDLYWYDDVSLGAFGVTVLKATNEARKPAPLKEPLVSVIASSDGAWYDRGDDIRGGSKQLTLECLMRAGTAEEFSRNYYGLFATLFSRQVSVLWDKNLNRKLPVYYAGGGFSTVKADGSVWAVLSLGFVVVGSDADLQLRHSTADSLLLTQEESTINVTNS